MKLNLRNKLKKTPWRNLICIWTCIVYDLMLTSKKFTWSFKLWNADKIFDNFFHVRKELPPPSKICYNQLWYQDPPTNKKLRLSFFFTFLFLVKPYLHECAKFSIFFPFKIIRPTIQRIVQFEILLIKLIPIE